MSKSFSVESPRFWNRSLKSIRCCWFSMRCAVRFKSPESESEFETEFVFVFIVFFFQMRVRSRTVALHEKACGTGRPAGVVFRGHRVRPPGRKQASGGRQAGNARQKTLENNHEAGRRVIASHDARSGAAGGFHARFSAGTKHDRRA